MSQGPHSCLELPSINSPRVVCVKEVEGLLKLLQLFFVDLRDPALRDDLPDMGGVHLGLQGVFELLRQFAAHI